VITAFVACDNGNGTNEEEFSSSINETISNNVDTLGLVGVTASSSNTGVATVEIVSGKIKITSVAQGTSVITVSDGTNSASINITISNSGTITIGSTEKYINLVGTTWKWTDRSNVVTVTFNSINTFTGIHPSGAIGGNYTRNNRNIQIVITLNAPPPPQPSTWEGIISENSIYFSTNGLTSMKE
jgi:hypothetical protein